MRLKWKKGGGDLFSITFCMCGYPFVFTIILNKMKRDKEFVKCISVKSSMGNSNPCIYLLKGIESTHGHRFRCLVTLRRPIRVENHLHLEVDLPILMPQNCFHL